MRKKLPGASLVAAGMLAAFCAVAPLHAQLINTSPFISANAPPPVATAPAAPIEFRGAFEMPDGIYFSIYDSATKRSRLVRVGDTGNPFVVRSYKSNPDQIVVDYQGTSQTLTLKKSKIQAMGSGAIGAPGIGAPPGVTATTTSSSASAMPNLPAGASIEDWAAEVQRRRELRTAPGTPGSPAAPAPDAVAPASAPAAPAPRG